MTKTTDSRQLGMIFRAILEKYGAWDALVSDGRDLQVEMNLVQAAKMYFAEVKQIGPVNVREKIFETLQLAAIKSAEDDNMISRIRAEFGINAGGTAWEDTIAFLIRQDKAGKTIERFAKACQEDKFEMPKAHQIAQKPSLIISMWPRAFADNAQVAEVKSLPKDGSGFYA